MKKECCVEACTLPVASKGMCWKHYRRNLRHGDVHAFFPNKGGECIVEGCKLDYYAKGLCKVHYKEQYKLQRDQGSVEEHGTH